MTDQYSLQTIYSFFKLLGAVTLVNEVAIMLNSGLTFYGVLICASVLLILSPCESLRIRVKRANVSVISLVVWGVPIGWQDATVQSLGVIALSLMPLVLVNFLAHRWFPLTKFEEQKMISLETNV